MLNQCPDSDWASKPHGVVKCGNAVLVARVDVGPSLEPCDEPPPLFGGVWILLGADVGQFMDGAHWALFCRKDFRSTESASLCVVLPANEEMAGEIISYTKLSAPPCRQFPRPRGHPSTATLHNVPTLHEHVRKGALSVGQYSTRLKRLGIFPSRRPG